MFLEDPEGREVGENRAGRLGPPTSRPPSGFTRPPFVVSPTFRTLLYTKSLIRDDGWRGVRTKRGPTGEKLLDRRGVGVVHPVSEVLNVPPKFDYS